MNYEEALFPSHPSEGWEGGLAPGQRTNATRQDVDMACSLVSDVT